MTYRCPTCSESHEGLPDIGFARPDPWFDVPEEERAARVRLTPDTCVIDDEDFFIRGVLFLPIVGDGEEDSFGLGVWVSQSRESFERYAGAGGDVANDALAPSFGWLSTRLPFYEPSTFGLETDVHFGAGDQRPSIVVHESEHPLSIDQRNGISLARAWEMVHRCGG